jgi:hypothetical protein
MAIQTTESIYKVGAEGSDGGLPTDGGRRATMVSRDSLRDVYAGVVVYDLPGAVMAPLWPTGRGNYAGRVGGLTCTPLTLSNRRSTISLPVIST